MTLSPYYEHAGITIYHGDCRDVLPGLSADVALTDPPYNVGIAYGEGVDDARLDYEAWCRTWFDILAVRVPVVAVTPGIANLSMWCRIKPPTWVLGWMKPAATGRGLMGFNNWEPVLVWGTPSAPRTNDAFQATVLPLDPQAEGHPCPKPLKWARQTLSRVAAPGETVLDPFSGSGTTLVAAKALGHRAIGIEIEERYCEIAARRLSQEAMPLFGEGDAA